MEAECEEQSTCDSLGFDGAAGVVRGLVGGRLGVGGAPHGQLVLPPLGPRRHRGGHALRLHTHPNKNTHVILWVLGCETMTLRLKRDDAPLRGGFHFSFLVWSVSNECVNTVFVQV